MTTDESALEKLRCLSAGGAKNFNQGLNSGELVWKMATSKHQKQH